MAPIWPRCGPDVAPIWPLYDLDMTSIWPRYGFDMSSVLTVVVMAALCHKSYLFM